MSETNAMGLGQDLARFRPCVGRSKIKRVIKLRLFKMAGSSHLVVLFCRERFHSAMVAVLTVLIVMTVAGSTFFSGCSG
ncbi:hypothetical protein Bca101_091851 [Brassica carinata]